MPEASKPARSMTIALAQMRCEKGAFAANLASIEQYISEARTAGAGIVCFPEMSITGYANPERMPEAIVRLDGPEVAEFAALTTGSTATVLAGIIEHNPAGKPFITQVVARGGTLVGHYRKRNVAQDELPWFAGSDAPAVFEHDGVRFGLAICADINKQAIFEDCAALGAEIVIEAAAPGLYGEQANRDWRSGWQWWRGECHQKLGAYARELGIHIAVATQAGRTVDEDFPGGGYLFGPTGACLAETSDWSEGLLVVTVPLAAPAPAASPGSAAHTPQSPAL